MYLENVRIACFGLLYSCQYTSSYFRVREAFNGQVVQVSVLAIHAHLSTGLPEQVGVPRRRHVPSTVREAITGSGDAANTPQSNQLYEKNGERAKPEPSNKLFKDVDVGKEHKMSVLVTNDIDLQSFFLRVQLQE